MSEPEASVPAKRRRRAWLLLPHAVAAAAFLAAFAVVFHTGTNRTMADRNLAILGGIALAAALFATLVGLFQHPWRRGRPGDWLLLGALLLALLAVLGLAFAWMGAHLA